MDKIMSKIKISGLKKILLLNSLNPHKKPVKKKYWEYFLSSLNFATVIPFFLWTILNVSNLTTGIINVLINLCFLLCIMLFRTTYSMYQDIKLSYCKVVKVINRDNKLSVLIEDNMLCTVNTKISLMKENHDDEELIIGEGLITHKQTNGFLYAKIDTKYEIKHIQDEKNLFVKPYIVLK